MSSTSNTPGSADPARGDGVLVVGIGASAGGIAALKAFFEHVTWGSNVAYVVILHLSPDHDSKLADVLQVTVPVPVTQVRSVAPIEADHVYVIPPNRSLEIVDGSLLVAEITRPEQRRAPVDVFFRTLADSHGSRAVCVILSGTGSNGSAGLKRIKEYGGLAIAQSPGQADHGDMPANAIATGLVDLVLPTEEMPAKILAYHQRLKQIVAAAPDGTDELDEAAALREILTLLRVRTGHDFSNYKPATLLRRIHRRMTVAGMAALGGYARWIREQPNEAVMLMRDLLISVTHFFRDAGVFGVLEERVIPRLLENKTPQDVVRVWVPACATGEEAYSLAMLLSEYLENRIDPPTVQIFATDLDEDAVAVAREGFYRNAEVADVTETRLDRFFQRETVGYRVRPDVRELILFAHHNILRDPPFSHLDLISCRNLLIYLNRLAQDRVFETFHFALRPGAYLLLGPSESPDGANDLFASVDRSVQLYQSRSTPNRPVLPETSRVTVARPHSRSPEPHQVERFASLDAHHRILEEYAPPSLIVTEDHTVVHLSGHAGQYLQMPAGEPSRDLMKLIRPELRTELRTALYQSAKQRTSVEVADVSVTLDGVPRRLSLVVRPVLREDEPTRGFFLVLFADRDGSNDPPRVVRSVDATAEPLAQQLEEELGRVKTQLRTTIEQYEAQVEEAQASAEEQQATNEELRSSAEELETSKEELESVNEELTTVNQELKIKIEELRLSNNDLQNLINSTDLATIFLDRALRVKLATPRARDVFNLLRSDIGRPLSDITSRLRYDHLDRDMQLVLDTLEPVDHEVQDVDGRWYLMRIRPYRTVEDHIDGLVVMFQDISTRRAAELTVSGSEERLRLLIDSATDYAIFTMTDAGVVDSWNTGAERLFGYAADEIIGQHFGALFTPEDRQEGVPEAELQRARLEGRAVGEHLHLRHDGSLFYGSGVTTWLGKGNGLGFAKIARDLTGQKTAAQALVDAQQALESKVAVRTIELAAEVERHHSAQRHVMRLVRKLVTTQEDERGRIARNLHDQLGQRLTALRLSLERIQTQSAAGDDLARALDLIKTIDSEVGFLAWELRPAVLDHLGLSVALPRYVDEWSEHYKVEANYNGGTFQKHGFISRDAEIAFYRIAQEALTNVAKHAHASRVDVLLEAREGALVLVIEDDGIGFELENAKVRERGLGLVGMQERAGLIGAEFELESKPGDGTSVYVRYLPDSDQSREQP